MLPVLLVLLFYLYVLRATSFYQFVKAYVCPAESILHSTNDHMGWINLQELMFSERK